MKRFLWLFLAASAEAQTPFTRNDYLEQVRATHLGYEGAKRIRDGSGDRTAQADLLTSFRLEGRAAKQLDAGGSDLSLGLVKPTNFGLEMKLSYEAHPRLTLTQSLWQNRMGRRVQAEEATIAAEAIADRESAEAGLDAIIQRAKMAYWNLVFKREIVKIQKSALEQSESIYQHNAKRSVMNLVDTADALQAKANLELRKLDLHSARVNEEIFLREFNLHRSRPPMEDPGELAPIDWKFVGDFKVPETRHDRSDIKAALSKTKADAARVSALRETYKPVLNAFGSVSSGDKSNASIGLTLAIPLDFDSLRRAEAAAYTQAAVSETNYQQKLREQEGTWQDLKQRIAAVQKRVDLGESIMKAQFEKLKYERERLKEGRTSTYQVLLFEQEYINARLARVQNASELVSLLSQIDLYNGKDEGGSE